MKRDIFNVLKTVISSRRYELADMLEKIDFIWAQGEISLEERLQLISDAQNNAMAENSIDVLKSLYDLNRRVAEVEKQIAELKEEENSDTPTEEETETPTYPPYEDGKWYQNGDIVEIDGLVYKCIAPIDTVCVWSPYEYPAYWEIQTV